MLEAARHAGVIEGLAKRAAVAVAQLRRHVRSRAARGHRTGRGDHRSGARRNRLPAVARGSDSEEDEERLANIEELLTAAREFDEINPGEGALEGFLEQTSLVNDTDAWEVDDDRATLMTLHAAKGLEFPVVFIVAVEDGLLPHERSRDWLDQTEEERRLFFVGITRAQEELYLSMAKYRSFRGQSRLTIPSRFLTELPVAEMEVQDFSWAAPVAWPQDHIDEMHDPGDRDDEEIVLDPVSASPATVSNGVRLMTAAELSAVATGIRREGEAPAEPATLAAVNPDAFHHGMVVRHPQYGLGKIIALSGNGTKAHRDGRVCTGRR